MFVAWADVVAGPGWKETSQVATPQQGQQERERRELENVNAVNENVRYRSVCIKCQAPVPLFSRFHGVALACDRYGLLKHGRI
jgi:hypothetical protein